MSVKTRNREGCSLHVIQCQIKNYGIHNWYMHKFTLLITWLKKCKYCTLLRIVLWNRPENRKAYLVNWKFDFKLSVIRECKYCNLRVWKGQDCRFQQQRIICLPLDLSHLKTQSHNLIVMSNNLYPNIYHYLKGLGSKKQQICLKLDLYLVNWKFDFKLSVIR